MEFTNSFCLEVYDTQRVCDWEMKGVGPGLVHRQGQDLPNVSRRLCTGRNWGACVTCVLYPLHRGSCCCHLCPLVSIGPARQAEHSRVVMHYSIQQIAVDSQPPARPHAKHHRKDKRNSGLLSPMQGSSVYKSASPGLPSSCAELLPQ